MSQRARENQRLLRRIRHHHEENDGMNGSPRIWEALRYEGEYCGKNRGARLMRIAEIKGIPQRTRCRKKDSGVRPGDVINHLEGAFDAEEANAKWVTDITYVRTAESWLYLCAVVNLYSKDWEIKFRPIHPRSPNLKGKVEPSKRTDLEEFYSSVDLNDSELNDRLDE